MRLPKICRNLSIAIALIGVLTIATLPFCSSCTGLKNLITDNNQTIQALASYYSSFSDGVKAALPFLAVIPGVSEYVVLTTTAVTLLDEGVLTLREMVAYATASDLETQKLKLWAIVQNINDIVARIQSAQTSGGKA